MGVTAEGSDIKDVRRQVFANERADWLIVNPVPSSFRDGPPDQFRVVCSNTGKYDSFTKTMDFKEACRTILALMKEQHTHYLVWKGEQEQLDRARQLRLVDEAKAIVKKAQQNLKEVIASGKAQKGS